MDELHVYSNDTDTYVAASTDDAKAVYAETYGEQYPLDDYPFEMVGDETTSSSSCSFSGASWAASVSAERSVACLRRCVVGEEFDDYEPPSWRDPINERDARECELLDRAGLGPREETEES